MNTKHKTTNNESDKPQWWLRFARLFRRASKLRAPRWTGIKIHHSELVVRNFPLTISKGLRQAYK